MKLILDGLNAGGADKQALLGFLRTGVQNRASVLGTYSLDANGDTTPAPTASTASSASSSCGRERSPAA